jgi:predicted nucleic acid-binding protein
MNPMEHLWGVEIKEIQATMERHARALRWSKRLRQTVAYDAQYLVVAEELGVPFRTAERGLAEAAHADEVDWVQWIGA